LTPLKPLSSEQALVEALDAALAVIYKHSSRCWICTKAERQVRQFAAEHPEVLVYQLDAVAGKDLAREVAGRLGVEHQSPQVIVVRKGQASWSGSHFRISTRILERETGLAD
jgi:bacillithiol system protein YtxJ